LHAAHPGYRGGRHGEAGGAVEEGLFVVGLEGAVGGYVAERETLVSVQRQVYKEKLRWQKQNGKF
jgi:hypothetical protein